MKHIYIHLPKVFLLLFFSCTSQKTDKKIETTLNAIDGPYIYKQDNKLTFFTVEKENDSAYYVQKENIEVNNKIFKCDVDNKEEDSFSFTLMENHITPQHTYKTQDKIFATSDIEGNFNTFYSLLVGNKIMDQNFNWIYGKGHLVIAGDMIDRGSNVIPCLWLLYKLEKDAATKGGKVHYILGNHDVMNLQNDIRYVDSKYIELAKILSEKKDKKEAYKHLMSNNNILVNWIKSKNTVEKIGNTLFLHGGISEEIVDAGISIEEMNMLVRANIHKNLYKNSGNNEIANLVLGRLGPLWYRGLVKDYKKYYKKIEPSSINRILEFYKVDHIVIGHTIVANEVTSDFDGRVIRIDIKHPSEKFTGKSQALLIENNNYFKVNDNGDRLELEFTD